MKQESSGSSPGPASGGLPVVRLDRTGQRHVDLPAVLRLVLPLFLNSSLQVVLNLTDTWFIGRLSTDAMAAMGACYYLIFVFFLLLGGVGIGVQTLVAQRIGARDPEGASRATWSGLWAALLTTPLFLLVAYRGDWLLQWFHLSPPVQALAQSFWFPRMLGGPLSTLLFALSSFYNGIGEPRHSFWIMALVAVSNAFLNQWFMFDCGYGMAGAALGSTVALGIGAVVAFLLFLSARFRRQYFTAVTWRPRRKGVWQVIALGLPTGLFPAMDMIGLGLFQMMQVSLGPINGAATQIVMMLTSVSYLPAIGIALTGTTLVGQSIGAGDRDWADRCARVIIRMSVIYMGTVGVLLGLFGHEVVAPFLSSATPDGAAVHRLCERLLWVAAGYQVFDALNLASAFCLRGAGDVRVPTLWLVLLSWGVFIPLCHSLTFPTGQGWVGFLPQWGWGALGGWSAALVYTVLLGCALWWRWRSGAWRRIDLGPMP